MSVWEALVVVDVQNDFVSGTMAVPDAESIIAPINRLAASAAHLIVTQDWHPPTHVSFASNHVGKRPGDSVEISYGRQKLFATHCVQDTWGAELAPGLRVSHAHLILRKGYRIELDSFSAFHWNDGVTRTGLAGYLRDRDVKRVLVAGLARFGCVLQSALGAAREGFEVGFVDDASKGNAGLSEAEGQALLDGAGIAVVHSSDALV